MIYDNNGNINSRINVDKNSNNDNSNRNNKNDNNVIRIIFRYRGETKRTKRKEKI